MTKKRRFVNVFVLSMLNLSALDSLRSLSITAEYGLQAVFYYLLVIFTFLIPSTIVCSKLSRVWPEGKGIFTWISAAFGEKWGFYAVFLQWVHNTMWLPTVLSFVAAAISFLFNPSWIMHKSFLVSVVILGIWGFTLLNCFGLQFSSMVSTFCSIFGTLIPGIILIGLALFWVIGGHPTEIPLSWDAVIPQINSAKDLVFIAAIVLSFAGLELSSVHAENIKNPTKTLPRAIFIAALMALILYIGGSFAIAISVPKSELSLVRGLMQAFSSYLGDNQWFSVIASAVVLGSFAELNSWTLGPARTLHAVAEHGDIPKVFRKLNRAGMPITIYFLQASLVTLFALVYLLIPSESGGFWILGALATQLYLLMYMILFFAALHLHIRKTRFQMNRLDQFFACIGILSAISVFCICFIPPIHINVGNIWVYDAFLLFGLFVFCLIPKLLLKKKESL